MSEIKVFVEVSDRYLWTLKPFAYLFNIYWSSLQPVIVAGYSRPNFRLPDNFQFFQIAPNNYPAENWSDGMIRFLKAQQDQHFVFLLCDYWLCRTVDVRGVQTCYEYIKHRPNVLRLDLTDDRQYAGGMIDIDMWGSYDIIETPPGTPYQMSTQAGIWNRELMLSLLNPKTSAWDVEIQTQPPEPIRVLGTRQKPIRDANAIHKGEIDFEALELIPEQHKNDIQTYIPERW